MSNRLYKQLFFILFSICSFFSFAQTKTLRFTVNSQANHFVISLPANPTTGYRWVIVKYDKSLLKCIKEKYEGVFPKRIGSGGKTQFTFERKKRSPSSRTKLIFSYERPWEADHQNLTEVDVIFKN